MSPSPVEELALADFDRSNKGASKQRRDLINAEIAVMRDLLPLTETARQRLSQLQVMSLSCVFIRKCNVLRQLFSTIPADTDMPTMCDFSQALTGFLLITTREGKLVYISENVTDYLGHSMVDMKTQGDSLFDIVDKRDESSVRAHLLQGGASEPDLTRDVTFFCRMNMSRTLKRQSAFGDVKVMHVRGHFVPLSDPSSDDQMRQQKRYVFMATCSPLITPELKESLIQSNTMVFKTVHQMDMTFLEVTKTAEFHLGCTMEEICRTSWYSMLHPEDIQEAREKHVLLMRASHELGCMMTVRMLTRKGEILWVNVVMQVRQSTSSQHEDGLIVCINQVISEEEAFQIRMQSHMFALCPPRTAELWSNAIAAHPQHGQTDPVCWMPASTSSSSTSLASPIPGLTNPISSSCGLIQPPQAVPTNSYVGGQQASANHHRSPSSSPPTAMLSASGHTDKLKLMLKRKLQSPSYPAKVPKMVWDENMRTRGRSNSGQEFERPAAKSPQQFPQFKVTGNVSKGYSGSASSTQYQAAHVLPLLASHQNVTMPAATSPASQGCLSPPLSTAAAGQGTEQVVPQTAPKMVLPDSFLTPDSSPASSPDLQASGGAMELTQRAVPVSVGLKDLDRLPTFIQAMHCAAVRKNPDPLIKTEKGSEECHHTNSRRELPIMDASDIESFFHTLDSEELCTAVGKGEKSQWMTTLPVMSTAVENMPTSKAVALNTQSPPIKQEAVATVGSPVSAGTQQQVQGLPKKAEQPQQCEEDLKELEELLGFFSGEMTATQLNLDSLLGCTMTKAGPEELDSSWQWDRQGHAVCGAGHLDQFLLHSACLDRPKEGFSPASSSDMSGDEDGSGEDTLDKPHKPVHPSKGEDREKRGCVPSSSPFPTPLNPHAPQDVPGIGEEDELYQLDKLLSLMASDHGVMLSQDSQ